MSRWGSLDAEFRGSKYVNAEVITDWLPRGSEGGPEVRQMDEGVVWVEGRLRDVSDQETSPAVLAWFCKHAAAWSTSGRLTWEIDGGPRYRYEWRDGELHKLRGVLDL
jgi:hypothetical protein